MDDAATIPMVGWDTWPVERNGYQHEVTFLKGNKRTPSKLMPRVHRVFSLLKGWLLGTHQGAVRQKHLDYPNFRSFEAVKIFLRSKSG
ncbi:MAG: hypothetical protein ACRD4Q_09660 [Candidatus Acidiferrales bacterium]